MRARPGGSRDGPPTLTTRAKRMPSSARLTKVGEGPERSAGNVSVYPFSLPRSDLALDILADDNVAVLPEAPL